MALSQDPAHKGGDPSAFRLKDAALYALIEIKDIFASNVSIGCKQPTRIIGHHV